MNKRDKEDKEIKCIIKELERENIFLRDKTINLRWKLFCTKRAFFKINKKYLLIKKYIKEGGIDR